MKVYSLPTGRVKRKTSWEYRCSFRRKGAELKERPKKQFPRKKTSKRVTEATERGKSLLSPERPLTWEKRVGTKTKATAHSENEII